MVNDVLAASGEQVAIPCTVKGITTRRIAQWRKDGNGLPRNGRFSVNNDGTLNILSVSQVDIGTYECMVENSLGRRTMKVKLNLVEHEGMLTLHFSLSDVGSTFLYRVTQKKTTQTTRCVKKV